MRQLSVLILMVGLLSSLSFAQTRAERRQNRQASRINRGLKNGSINEKEARRLEKQQSHIQKMEDKFTSDGNVSKKEKIRLEKAQDRSSRQIYRTKHNKK